MERLNAGEVVIGDGGFVFALEKRGYVKAGPWTPEAAAEHPEAGDDQASTHFFIYLCIYLFVVLDHNRFGIWALLHWMSRSLVLCV